MTAKSPPALVEPDWLEEHLGDPGVRLVEIAWVDTESYDKGHIPGALGWQWKDWLWDPRTREFPAPGEFARRCGSAGIGNDTTVVFYGDPVQFGTYAWWVFKYLDHADARILNGAKLRWTKEGRAMTTDLPEIAPASYRAPTRRHDRMRASRDDVLESLPAFASGADMVLLDHRSPEEYKGERVNGPGSPDVGAERYGRIPGSRHLHYTDFLTGDHSFKPAGELAALLVGQGAGPDKDIVSYCRLSHRATLAYFVMTELLGYERVRSYDGSWTEWGSMVGMPVEI